MRQFDHEGLLLAEYQGRLFERSADLDCSSPVFLRRFLHSDLLKKLDLNSTAFVSLDVEEGVDSILKQYHSAGVGSTKYSKSALFWIGYMYRYISYTREQSTNIVMSFFSHSQMNEVYSAYHTQDPEWCVRSLLETNGLDECAFDSNERLKKIIKTQSHH